MNYAIDYSDLVHPAAFSRDPSDEEIAKVADSVEAYLMLDEAKWQEAAKDYLDYNIDEAFAVAMRAGQWADAGLILHQKTVEQLREHAVELATSWLNDELTIHQREVLSGWRPVKYASLGRKYFLAELLG